MGEEARVERLGSNESIQSAQEYFDRTAIEAEAHDLIRNRHEQPENVVYMAEYIDNARTALMEALTASGHLSQVELHGTLEEINQQVMNRLLNGWDETLPEHEQTRRFHEICEELIIQKTHRAIVAGQLPENTAVAIVSDCPVVEMKGIGYRYANNKGMVRSTHLRKNADGSHTRLIEQVSRSNSGWKSTFGFLGSCGITVEAGFDPDIAALRTPVLYNQHDLVDGVVDIQKKLDYFAGAGVLYGEKDSSRHVDYADLRQESLKRENEIKGYVNKLANLEKELDQRVAAKTLSPEKSRAIFEMQVEEILDVICTKKPQYVTDTYGEKAKQVFNYAAVLSQAGRHEEAAQFIKDNRHLKEQIHFCGVSITMDEAKRLGLPVNDFGELLEDSPEDWDWKPGVCRVDVCPTRPGKTMVGPCSVCESCQDEFNRGNDPTKRKPTPQPVAVAPMIAKLLSIDKKRQEKLEDSTIKIEALAA